MDGSIIICTESGHVFVRSRNLKAGQGSSAKTFKFQRIPYVQRVIRVCANATGAFAALRDDFRPAEVKVVGNRLPQDLAGVQPYLKLINPDEHNPLGMSGTALSPSSEVPPDSDEEEEDSAVQGDIRQLKALASVILRLKEVRKGSDGADGLDYSNLPYDADLIVHVQSNGIELPAHRAILAARSSVFAEVLSTAKTVRDPKSSIADRKSTRLNSSHSGESRMPSSA